MKRSESINIFQQKNQPTGCIDYCKRYFLSSISVNGKACLSVIVVLIFYTFFVNLGVYEGANAIYHITIAPLLTNSTNSIINRRTIPEDGFLTAYVVNLDHRTDRMKFMKEQLTNLTIPYQRLSAYNFDKGNENLYKQLKKTSLHPETKFDLSEAKKQWKVTWGEIGCWQSHLQIYFQYANGTLPPCEPVNHNNHQLPSPSPSPSLLPPALERVLTDAQDAKERPILILEDDVRLFPNITNYLSEKYLNTILPNDWEMLFLDHLGLICDNYYLNRLRPSQRLYDYFYLFYYYPFIKYTLLPTFPQLKPFFPSIKAREYTKRSDATCRLSNTFLTSSYIIRSPAVARKLIEASNTPYPQIADIYWNTKLFANHKINAYALLHPVTFQYRNTFGSDVPKTPGRKKGSGSHMRGS